METQLSTVEEAIEEVTSCVACMTIPVSHLALEVEPPLSGSWQPLFDELNIKTVIDPAGRVAIVVPAARKLLAHLRHRTELAIEGHDAMFAKVAARHPVPVSAAVAMQEGMSAFESLAVAAGGVVSVEAEFGNGREKPHFLKDELEASRRADAEKLRFAKQMKDKLGGKR